MTQHNRFAVCLAAGLLVALVLTFAGRGSFLHLMGVIVLCVWVGLPLAVVAGILYITARVKQSARLKSIATKVLAAALLVLLQLLSLPTGSWLNRRDVDRAKSFAEAIVPSLNQFKDANGNFPPTLSPLLRQETSVPRLLYYQADPDGQHYFFTVTEPADMMAWYEFSSMEPQWRRAD